MKKFAIQIVCFLIGFIGASLIMKDEPDVMVIKMIIILIGLVMAVVIFIIDDSKTQ